MAAYHYLGVTGVAEAMGVTGSAVHKWRARHPSGSNTPFPEPDLEIDGSPAWRPERLTEIVRWRERLPRRGEGYPPTSRRAFLAAAEARDFTPDEAWRAVAAFVEEFPEMTEHDVQAWLVSEWRGMTPESAAR